LRHNSAIFDKFINALLHNILSLTAVRTQKLFIFALRKTKCSTFLANRQVRVLRMSGSRESLSLRLQARTSERRPRSDYYSYSVYARLL